jgi:hypothetical protein
MFTSPESPRKQIQKPRSRKIVKILLEAIFMSAILAGLIWYVGINSLYYALLNIRIEYLLLAFLMYFVGVCRILKASEHILLWKPLRLSGFSSTKWSFLQSLRDVGIQVTGALEP